MLQIALENADSNSTQDIAMHASSRRQLCGQEVTNNEGL